MDKLHYRPAPSPEAADQSDRLVFPSPHRAVRLRLHLDEQPAPSANPMEDSAMWMDAAIDSAQDRIDAIRSLLSAEAAGDDDGPRAA